MRLAEEGIKHGIYTLAIPYMGIEEHTERVQYIHRGTVQHVSNDNLRFLVYLIIISTPPDDIGLLLLCYKLALCSLSLTTPERGFSPISTYLG